jgi:hypothetical protein
MLKRKLFFASLCLCLSILLFSCTNPGRDTTDDTPRADGDSEVISVEADWARRVASLRGDDAGTNNGRTRIAVLEILYALQAQLETRGNTSQLRQDLDVVRDTVERMYSSANVGARGEWQSVSREFTILQNQLDKPQEAQRALTQLITSLGG